MFRKCKSLDNLHNTNRDSSPLQVYTIEIKEHPIQSPCMSESVPKKYYQNLQLQAQKYQLYASRKATMQAKENKQAFLDIENWM